MWEIRPAREEDAAQLSEVARQIFLDTFGPFNTPEDIAMYCAQTFTPEVMMAAIRDPKTAMLVATHNNAMIAYAHLYRGDAPSEVTGPSPIELKRFYVLQEWHGTGLAHALMNGVATRSSELGAETLWLGVWEHNTRAIRFYQKLGFEVVGECVFILGDDRQNDFVMVVPIEALRKKIKPDD